MSLFVVAASLFLSVCHFRTFSILSFLSVSCFVSAILLTYVHGLVVFESLIRQHRSCTSSSSTGLLCLPFSNLQRSLISFCFLIRFRFSHPSFFLFVAFLLISSFSSSSKSKEACSLSPTWVGSAQREESGSMSSRTFALSSSLYESIRSLVSPLSHLLLLLFFNSLSLSLFFPSPLPHSPLFLSPR